MMGCALMPTDYTMYDTYMNEFEAMPDDSTYGNYEAGPDYGWNTYNPRRNLRGDEKDFLDSDKAVEAIDKKAVNEAANTDTNANGALVAVKPEQKIQNPYWRS